MKRIVSFWMMAVVAVAMAVPSMAQDKTVKKIIETGKNDNQVMVHENHLANYIGGRPVGSSALTHAEAWVKEQFESCISRARSTHSRDREPSENDGQHKDKHQCNDVSRNGIADDRQDLCKVIYLSTFMHGTIYAKRYGEENGVKYVDSDANDWLNE